MIMKSAFAKGKIPRVKLGKSDGQKAAGKSEVVDKKYNDVDNAELAEGGYGVSHYDSKSEIRKDMSDKANKKQVKRIAKKAKSGGRMKKCKYGCK